MVPFCRYLISRLDEHGDGFRDAQVPVMWEVSFRLLLHEHGDGFRDAQVSVMWEVSFAS